MNNRYPQQVDLAYLLFVSTLLSMDRLPHEGKTFVKAQLLPHLKPFLPAEGSAFYGTVNFAMGESVVVSVIVESTIKIHFRAKQG